jgi:prepilin-type processing-associated H-X9-DG protein
MNLVRIGVALVVVSVFAIITFTVSRQRTEDVKRVASTRNLQQWGIALNLHLIDHENQLPETGSTPIEASQTKAWYNALPPYISQTPLAELAPGNRPRPGVPSLWIDPATPAVKVWDPSVFYFNYAMNRALQPDEKLRSFRIYEIPHPGHVIFLAEVNGYSPVATPDTAVFRHGSTKKNDPKASANVLFCDGHVQPVTRAVLTAPESHSAATAATGPSWFEK